MRGRGLIVGAATLTGLALGWTFAQRHLRRHRQDLFNPRPFRRLAALGFLEGEATPEAVPLLRDYVAWEPRPRLRRRGLALLRRLETVSG